MMMREGSAPVVYRQDYRPPAYWIKTVDLAFDLAQTKTLVINRMQIEPNPAVAAQPLRLHGEGLSLLRVILNDEPVSFKQEDGFLVIDQVPSTPFLLEIRTACAPDQNTELCGLYASQNGLFTQCEAEGFRRITYFLDQPDVMAVFTVTLLADKATYPVLLSNGNLVSQGDTPDGKHFACWHDPYPKPSYLFALVAANLVAREQRVRTRAGRSHLLQIYVRPGDLDKTEHAMNALVASLIWDEARFGLALDLERFMVVAVADFNMGAMENKGLNIFNTKYVLATAQTATDDDHDGVQSVIAHEYFHNWTGNRVTCRDWFQLSLKEGLTVFRDQEFSMDMAASVSARAVKRIEDVRHLWQTQFPEDAGSMAHPVRPDSYAEINNFYTATIYEKGAEVVRMMQTLVGREGFAAGMALYFARHDGQAVTCDDFAQAIADANVGSALHQHLDAFKHWYSQAGTPRLAARGQYDATNRTYTLHLTQSSLPSPGQTHKAPYVIPIAMGLVGRDGRAMLLQFEGQTQAPTTEHVLVMTEASHVYTFVNVDAEPVPSLLRGFCAPVQLQHDLNDADALCLLSHDSDPFNRWDAGQRLALARLLPIITTPGASFKLDDALITAMRQVLRHPELDPAFKALVLRLPSETHIAEQLQVVDPQRIAQVRQAMRSQLAQALHADWEWAYLHHQNNTGYSPGGPQAAKRSLANLSLLMLCLSAQATGDQVWPGKALQRFKVASNMTDRLGALIALMESQSPLAANALERLYTQFAHEPLVIDTWFALQAGACEHDSKVFQQVEQLLKHPDFSLKNPNRARSVIGAFCLGNPGAFHRPDGQGYLWWAEQVLALDAINPQLAARIARALDRLDALAEPYRQGALQALQRLTACDTLSSHVREIITRALSTPSSSPHTTS